MRELIEKLASLSTSENNYVGRLERLLFLIDEIDPTIAKRIKIDENGNPKRTT